MKRLVLAGLLALPALGLWQERASAWCLCPTPFHIEMPLPTIPLPIPNLKLSCPACHCPGHGWHHRCGGNGHAPPNAFNYGPPAPWYTQYPPHATFGTPNPYGTPSPYVAPGYTAPGYAPGAVAPPPAPRGQGVAGGSTQPISYYPGNYYQPAPADYGYGGSYAAPSYWYGR